MEVPFRGSAKYFHCDLHSLAGRAPKAWQLELAPHINANAKSGQEQRGISEFRLDRGAGVGGSWQRTKCGIHLGVAACKCLTLYNNKSKSVAKQEKKANKRGTHKYTHHIYICYGFFFLFVIFLGLYLRRFYFPFCSLSFAYFSCSIFIATSPTTTATTKMLRKYLRFYVHSKNLFSLFFMPFFPPIDLVHFSSHFFLCIQIFALQMLVVAAFYDLLVLCVCTMLRICVCVGIGIGTRRENIR